MRRLLRVGAAAVLMFSAGCATSRSSKKTEAGKADVEESSSGWDIGQCRPLFPATSGSLRDISYDAPSHSCWHRFWEVPAALVVYPVIVGVAVGVVTSPIWVPLLLHPF